MSLFWYVQERPVPFRTPFREIWLSLKKDNHRKECAGITPTVRVPPPNKHRLMEGRSWRQGAGGCAPPHPTPPRPEMTCGFLKQLVFCKKALWVSYRIRRAPPPMKNPGSAPVRWFETRRGYSVTRIASSDYGYHVTWITDLTPKHDLAFLLFGWKENWKWILFTWSPIVLLCWWLTVSFDECQMQGSWISLEMK